MGFSLFATACRPVLGPTHPPTHWIQEGLTLKLKQQVREDDHLLPSSAAFKNAWSYTSIPP
jgi:hypothetical protein